MRTRPNSHLEVIRQIRRLLWLLPICSLSMPACRKDAEKPRSEPPKGSQAVETAALAKLQQRSKSTEPQAAADKPKLDNLRALPYLDFVKHDAGSENQSGVTYRDEAASAPGYNLYTIHPLCAAELIDETGKSIRFWRQQPGQHWANCLLLENGDLLAVGADPRPEGTGFDTGFADESRYLLRMNWEGILLWKKPVNAHHDIEPAPAGQFVTMTFERRAIPAISNDTESRDDQITLIDGGGNVVQSLSLYDLLSNRPDLFTFQNVSPQLLGGKQIIDLFHSNSVQWMPGGKLERVNPIFAATNVLVSSRNQDSIFIINWEKKELVWTWGRGVLQAQHDAQVLDNGHILLFDNGAERGFSRVVEMDPSTGNIIWEFKTPDPKDFYSLSRGAAQRLGNGNTLIADSDHGRAFEITPAGEVVWDFLCPYKSPDGNRASIVRMRRLDHQFVDNLIKRTASADKSKTP